MKNQAVQMNPTDKKIAEIQAGLNAMREIARDYGFFPLEFIEQAENELAEFINWRLRFAKEQKILAKMQGLIAEERKTTK
jgi:hypothetical protein